MPSSHRLYYLTSCVANCVFRREVQAWGLPLRRLREVGLRDSFSTIPGADKQRFGLRQAPACFGSQEADKGDMGDMMEKFCVERQSLGDEVRSAVEDLGWPSRISRRWTRPGDAGVGSGVEDDDGAFAGGAGGPEGGMKLKVLQWNVLCDGLSGSHPEKGGFVRAPEDSLDWEKRRWKILEEILSWDCDVLALQEVDHHHDWLSPMLARGGYRSLFVKKPLAPGKEYGPDLEDGCSVFYRSRRGSPTGDGESAGTQQAQTTLELLDSHGFTFAVAEGPGGEGGFPEAGGGHAAPRIQNQVAILALFRVHRAGCGDGEATEEDAKGRQGSLVVLATTHLKAVKTEGGEEARARQASQLLSEVERFREGHAAGRGLPSRSIPVVISGDFNATPRATRTGGKDGGGYEPLCYRRIVSHPLKLQSAFPLVEDTYTTFKIRRVTSAEGGQGTASGVETTLRETCHCIDYVWMSEGVRAARLSSFPAVEQLGPERIPSYAYPSDHLALAVELLLP